MCQLLGMSCKEPATINFSFEGFKARGGLTDEHKDGWGIAFYENQGCRIFLDHQPAHSSPLAQTIKAQHIKSRTVIAHIRKATVGEVSLRNCHPFKRELWGKVWVFSHNGTLVNFEVLLADTFVPEGETDSERAFCYIMSQLVKRFPDATETEPPTIPEIYSVLRQLVLEIAACGVFNVMVSNGDILFAHCSTHLSYVSRCYPFTQATLVDCDMSIDLSAHNSPADRIVVIATKPLTCNETWIICQPGETLLFQDGSILLQNGRVPAESQRDERHKGKSLATNASALVDSCLPDVGLLPSQQAKLL
jgi:predicted glutamine amidotransferase